jgi:hypothetical protein
MENVVQIERHEKADSRLRGSYEEETQHGGAEKPVAKQ